MIAPINQTPEQTTTTWSQHSLTAVSLAFAGLLLGGLFTWVWPALNGLAAIGIYLLGIALPFVVGTLLLARWRAPLRWDLLFFGQVLAAVGAALLLVVSLI